MSTQFKLSHSHFDFVLARARVLMQQNGVDALILTKPEDIYYFTGIASFFAYQFKPSPAAIVVVYKDASCPTAIILNEFEAASTTIVLPCHETHTFPVWVDVDDPLNTSDELSERPIEAPVAMMLKALHSNLIAKKQSIKSVALDSQSLGFEHYLLFKEALNNYHVAPLKSILDLTRMIKSQDEIKMLTRAAQITEIGITQAIEALSVNTSHATLVSQYQQAIYQFEETQLSRFHIISIGEQFSPILHPAPIKTKMGDLVKFDCGVEVNGYGADLARTAILGEPSQTIQQIYNIILQSHSQMLDNIRVGGKLADLFNQSIQTIRKLGLKRYNRGHLGHSTGVSLSLEEYPFISENATAHFEKDMVLCLETPYYGLGIGAIMIEDMVHITETGAKLLSHRTRDLIIKN